MGSEYKLDAGMQEQAGTNFWSPEKEGDELRGEIIAVKEGEYGKQWIVRQTDGAEQMTPSHKVLQNRLAKASIGDHVQIIYTGTEPATKRGYKPTAMYLVGIKPKAV